MGKIILDNAFNILGLETTASEKEILKRSKEISNLIKIDETPEYEADILINKKLRNDNSVKEASQKLSDPKKRIKEYFFWFDIQDTTDEEAISSIKNGEYENAIKIWNGAIEKNNSKRYFYEKNLAILYLLLLNDQDNKTFLNESLQLWEKLIKEDKFWTNFKKLYKLNDTLNSSLEVVNSFEEISSTYLADLYTELSEKYDSSYRSEFSKSFGAKGAKLEKDILNPIYNNINDAVQELQSMNVTANGVVDEEEIAKVKLLIKKFQEEINKIIDLGLYEDSQTKIIRDRAADAIRKTVLDIYNNLRETEKSLALLNIAHEISGTGGMTNKIEEDIKIIEKNKKDDETIEPILKLVKEEKWDDALELIDTQSKKDTDNQDPQLFYKNHKKMCVTVIGAKLVGEARKKIDTGKYDQGKALYEEVITLFTANLSLYNVNKEELQVYIDRIKDMIPKVNVKNLSEVDTFRNETFGMLDKNFGEQNEAYALKFLMDAYIFSGLADFYKKNKNKSRIVQVGYWIGVILFFQAWWLGLIIVAGVWYYSNKTE